MLERLVRLIPPAIDGRRIAADLAELYARDRWFTHPRFQESARYALGRLQARQLDDAAVVQFPADGKTLYGGSWRVGLAWDARAASLTVVEPAALAGRVLADYQQTPCSLVMWSGPTPAGGLETTVVDVGAGTRAADYAGKDVRGKIVLVGDRAVAVKGMAARHGAVGVLTDSSPQPAKLSDSVFWNNAFADAPGGWGATANGSRLFGFTLSPRAGQELRQLLAAGQTVRVRAVVDTRLFAGEFPVVTGLLAGRTDQEVLAIGHAFEQGAKDNASGVACILEAVGALAALVRDGKLPRPRRGIRALITNECYGTLGYVERFPERVGRTVAGLCLDEAGVDQQCPGEVQALHAGAHSRASYLDAFAAALAGRLWAATGEWANPWVREPYATTDNLIGHASIGIPTVWVGCAGGRLTWHNSIDTPDRMSRAQLRAAAAYAAAYLYFVADAGPREAAWLAGLAADAGRQEMERAVAALALDAAPGRTCRRPAQALAQRLAYLTTVHAQAVRGVFRLARDAGTKAAVAGHVKDLNRHAASLLTTAGAAGDELAGRAIVSPFDTPMPAAAQQVRPAPAVTGPITYDPIPPDRRDGHVDPRWDGAVNVALGWADGRRTLAEVVALAEHELGRALPGVAEELLWLIPHGLVADAGPQGRPRPTCTVVRPARVRRVPTP